MQGHRERSPLSRALGQRPDRRRGPLTWLLVPWWVATLACGFGQSEDEEPSQGVTTAPAVSTDEPRAAAPFALAPSEHGFECPREDPMHCAVYSQFWNGDNGLTRVELWLVGPPGTEFQVGPVRHTLAAGEDAPPGTLTPSNRSHREIRSSDARTVMSFPIDALLSSLSGLCDRTGPPPTLQVRVAVPGRAPAEMSWAFDWAQISRLVSFRLDQAIAGEIELPPATGNVVYRGGCDGGEVSQLSDIRFRARSETLTRSTRCGTYRTSSGRQRTVTRRLYDERLEIWDIRARRRLGRTTIRAPSVPCPRQVRQHSDVTSSVDSMEVIEWFQAQIARLPSEP